METITERVKTRLLPCRLTEEEIDLRARLNSNKMQELLNAEQAAKDVAAEWKEKVKGIRANVQDLTTVVNTGVEFRDVEVYERQNHTDGTVEIIRRDTHEVIDTRSMKAHERQHRLPLET